MFYISLFYTFAHYVQITNATGGSKLEYYSDGKLLISKNLNIYTLYIVKGKK